MLKIKGLCKTYGKFRALNGLDMEVKNGALYGFAGPNGAGKTTTIRIIVGLLTADSGSMEIDGIDGLAHPELLKEKIGYVPDDFGIYDNLKVWEYMEFFASCYGMEGLSARKRAQTLVEQVGLGDREDFFVDNLSRGMKQRLSLARALLHDPALLVLDEPTAGLDPRTRLEFKDTLRDLSESGKTILVSSHLLSELSELCTDIGIVNDGKMVLEASVEEMALRVHTARPLMIQVYEGMDAAMQLLKEDPLVRTITVRDQEIVVGYTGNVDQECSLLAQLTKAGVKVRGFMRESGDLEAVFMQLTNQEEERTVLSYENEPDL